MKDAWDTLKQELAVYGFRLLDGQRCQFFKSDQLTETSLSEVYSILGNELSENKQLLTQLWRELHQSLSTKNQPAAAIDPRLSRLFVSALKDLAIWLTMFDPKEVEPFVKIVEYALQRDILSYSSDQINAVIDYKIAIDWIHRIISRQLYTRRLIQFAHDGREKANQSKIVEARGVGGPWSNLDMPMKERVWKWWEEDENFRNRDGELRRQRRYRKGLENYNNGGSVGEGHYWREVRNEPYSWYSRQDNSPYPGRNTLFWG